MSILKVDSIGASRGRKISSGNFTGGAAYFAANLGRLNIGKPQEKVGSPTKDAPSSASEDEQADSKSNSPVTHKPKFAKRKQSEQHGPLHATSLLDQLYEKKHQQHLQQLQQNANTGKIPEMIWMPR